MADVSSLIITGFGINCEEEMASAYRLAGADAKTIHINEVLLKGFSIQTFDIVNFPGGFSFGDDISSGKVLANKIKYRKLSSGNTFLDELKRFIDDGKYILGVCNGFQVLVKLGLLPNTNDRIEQEVTLSTNDSAMFEDRWCYCKVLQESNTPFLKGLDVISLPVRHGEGKLTIRDNSIREAIEDKSLNCLSYCDSNGNITSEYPLNPNGADLNCAGLTDNTGRVLGMMPHPEAYLSLYNNPNWSAIKRQSPTIGDDGEGFMIFKNIVNHIRQSKRN
jgi:phosphoribosylformylglycinamidine synthase subunit PurQ / glutaminase